MKPEYLRMHDLYVYHNKYGKDEYVEIKTICQEYCLVSHIREHGSWIVYYKDDALTKIDESEIKNVLIEYKKNLVIATLIKCRLIGQNADEELVKRVKYEANYVTPNFEQYKQYLKKI